MMEFIPPATRFVALPDGFKLKRGGTLSGARMAYESVGRLNATRTNAVLILTGLSPDAHVCAHEQHPAPGWWEGMVGPGKPVDTDRWFVVCVNSLGSCKGSTGPASVDPATGLPYGPEFPALSIEDLADAAAHVVRALGIEQLAVVVGASMGGMTALSLVARHPGLARHMINLSGAVHAQPFAIALRALQREMIQSDPQWQQGRYDAASVPISGMVAARKLGLLSYRAPDDWSRRFGRERLDAALASAAGMPAMDFAVEGYLACHAQRFVRAFDPNAYLALSRAIDRFDLGDEAAGDADAALRRLQLDRALVMGVDSDFLFPLSQQRQVAQGLQQGGVGVTYRAVSSLAGHDAFLADLAQFGPPIAAFLSDVASGARSAEAASDVGQASLTASSSVSSPSASLAASTASSVASSTACSTAIATAPSTASSTAIAPVPSMAASTAPSTASSTAPSMAAVTVTPL